MFKEETIDNAQCELCRKTFFRANIHHKDGNHNNNRKNNLIVLCSRCHRKVHNKKKHLSYISWKEQLMFEDLREKLKKKKKKI